MKTIAALCTLGLLASAQAFAQTSQPDPSMPTPSGTTYQSERKDMPEQVAEMPKDEAPSRGAHPGTLRTFNSDSNPGTEVQFDIDRREAAKKIEPK